VLLGCPGPLEALEELAEMEATAARVLPGLLALLADLARWVLVAFPALLEETVALAHKAPRVLLVSVALRVPLVPLVLVELRELLDLAARLAPADAEDLLALLAEMEIPEPRVPPAQLALLAATALLVQKASEEHVVSAEPEASAAAMARVERAVLVPPVLVVLLAPLARLVPLVPPASLLSSSPKTKRNRPRSQRCWPPAPPV